MYREDAIKDHFNTISSTIIKICQQHQIKELILGYNINWKTGVNIGSNNNRKFYQVPYRKLIHMLFYKGENSGIKVVENEESYTSKCDALALENVGFNHTYVGQRVKRGMFQSARGVLINADVNGAINIMRKYVTKTYTFLANVLDTIVQNTPLSRLCNPIKIKNAKSHPMIFQGRLRGTVTVPLLQRTSA